mmetsp:Transcript_98538/g.257459  ORF Transcript_98538/g.257459 Transcript_98538/m.257459 type:complete len:255 (+) Transcript_98538:161-925(+)
MHPQREHSFTDGGEVVARETGRAHLWANCRRLWLQPDPHRPQCRGLHGQEVPAPAHAEGRGLARLLPGSARALLRCLGGTGGNGGGGGGRAPDRGLGGSGKAARQRQTPRGAGRRKRREPGVERRRAAQAAFLRENADGLEGEVGVGGLDGFLIQLNAATARGVNGAAGRRRALRGERGEQLSCVRGPLQLPNDQWGAQRSVRGPELLRGFDRPRTGSLGPGPRGYRNLGGAPIVEGVANGAWRGCGRVSGSAH